MKRKLLLLILMIILGMLFVACGGGDTTDEATTEPATETEEEAAPEEEPAPEEEEAAPEEEMEEAMGEGGIAVLLPDSASSARWEADDRRFFEQAFDAAGVEYTIVNAEGDASTQQTQAEQAITNGAKVLLMVNLDSGSGAAIIAQAREAGVNVIDYDRLTIEGPGADFYVSFDNEAVGRLQGEGIVQCIEDAGLENPNVAVLNGSPTDNNATLFANGYNSVITPYFDSGDWTLVDDQSVPDWDNQQALVIFEQMLTAAAGEIDAAVAANDGLGGAVSAALKNQGLDQIPVTGQDATAAGIQRILAGEQCMTVYKAIKAEAEAAAALAIALLNGEDTSAMASGSVNNGTNDVASVLLVPVSVTKENIEETVIADGFRTWDEICVGDYATYCDAASGEEMEEEMAEGMHECSEDLTGETIVLYQHAGREGPLAQILGDAFALATEDALTAVNESGGICGAEVVVQFEETNYAAELEVEKYEKSREADPKPIVLFTYGSAATVALKDRVIEDQIVNFAAGVNGPAIYDPRDGYTIGVVPIYSDQFAGFMKFLSENWDDVKPESAGDDIVVGVVGWANSFGAGATTDEALAYAESLGITVLPLEEQAIAPDADVSGAIQNLLLQGANVIYSQALSFGPAQVIGTTRALGVWDDVVIGGVNWSFNNDVLNILGENVALADGYYGVVPYYTWNDSDLPVIQDANAAFEAGDYPETERTNTYLQTYAVFFAVRDVMEHAINEYGYENLSGETFMLAMQDLGIVSASGLFDFDVRGENRAPSTTTIRQWQLQEDGTILDVPITDFFELPDTRPPVE